MRGTTDEQGMSRYKRLEFQLTCPMRGTTRVHKVRGLVVDISTHVPHAGHDSCRLPCASVRRHFNSRAPCGARPSLHSPNRLFVIFQLTCPMRGTTTTFINCNVTFLISTHVPHAGHDFFFYFTYELFNISTHVPHAGHDPPDTSRLCTAVHFNSRAPCGARLILLQYVFNFNPFQLTCPMRGTTTLDNPSSIPFIISTHVPHAGHDTTNIDTLP